MTDVIIERYLVVLDDLEARMRGLAEIMFRDYGHECGPWFASAEPLPFKGMYCPKCNISIVVQPILPMGVTKFGFFIVFEEDKCRGWHRDSAPVAAVSEWGLKEI